MADTHDLNQLDANSFEHMVNFLALKVLGSGVTGFAPGSDGGRDGLLSGEAPYPTKSERWSGTWYIQSKFHKPHLSTNSQSWLVSQVKKELKDFEDSDSRVVPDIWIVATNIEPSGTPQTGSFDVIKKLVFEVFGDAVKVDVWGGRRILDFLAKDPHVASYYGHFLTPGHVLTEIYNKIGDSAAQIKSIIDHLILDQFCDQIYTKLEQAGSSGIRPKIHELFVDLPAEDAEFDDQYLILETLAATSANIHKPSLANSYGEAWREWSKLPRRARVLLLKGGPGQGKSTAGQFYSQIHRASLLLEPGAPITLPGNLEVAREVLHVAERLGYKPKSARIPVSIELKDFATWYGTRELNESKGILSYLCDRISQKLDQPVEGGTLKRAISTRGWFFNFDGLDEVPNDVKDNVADEIIRLTNVILPQIDADILVLCTTRPQGYSGQFVELDAVTLELCSLPPLISMKCAENLIKFGHTETESKHAIQVLASAMESHQVRELMTTPLQSHIMAVVVREGGRPPEKRWELFENFYQVMKRRESLKNFPDVRINLLLRENSTLLRAIHARLGISLHSSAEISAGAETTLRRDQFSFLAKQTTERYVEENVDQLVETLMEATIERLVFVNTPESSNTVRFDIRQLQEFFAAEFIYSNVQPNELRSRLEVIGGDSHWREVMHFAISALIVTMRPTELAVALEVICKLDDSDHSHILRTFKRRSGVGAILTLRLLNEGVLEQDRAIRLKFKDALVPLYGMLDGGVTSTISSLHQPNTLSWLLNCMIDALFEYTETEQIGAAIVLCRKLPDTHPRATEVANKIFGSSVSYLNAIYRSFVRDHDMMYGGQSNANSVDWFVSRSISLIVTAKPLVGLDFLGVIRVLRRFFKTNPSVFIGKFSPDEQRLLLLLMENPELDKRFKQNFTKNYDITVAEYECNWRERKTISELDFPILLADIRSPILRVLGNTLEFARLDDLKSLLNVLTLMVEYKLGRLFLPAPLEAMLPVDFDSRDLTEQLEYFKSLSESEFSLLMVRERNQPSDLPSSQALIELTSVPNLDSYRLLARISPNFTISYWLQPYPIHGDGGRARSSDIDKFMLGILKKHITSLGLNFACWGDMFCFFPAEEDRLRSLLRENVSILQVPELFREISPFLIKLPEEYVFLVFLAQILIPLEKQNAFSIHSENPKSRYDVLLSYGLDESKLENVFKNAEIDLTYRAAALCCYLSLMESAHFPLSKRFFGTETSIYVLQFCEGIKARWYINSICYALNRQECGSTESMEFVGQMLYIYNSNYEARSMLHGLLADWRERSHAPVNRCEVLEAWLTA